MLTKFDDLVHQLPSFIEHTFIHRQFWRRHSVRESTLQLLKYRTDVDGTTTAAMPRRRHLDVVLWLSRSLCVCLCTLYLFLSLGSRVTTSLPLPSAEEGKRLDSRSRSRYPKQEESSFQRAFTFPSSFFLPSLSLFLGLSSFLLSLSVSLFLTHVHSLTLSFFLYLFLSLSRSFSRARSLTQRNTPRFARTFLRFSSYTFLFNVSIFLFCSFVFRLVVSTFKRVVH